MTVGKVIRRLLGMALGVVGVVAPAWGIFHIVRTPGCGSSDTYVTTTACPDEMGLWIVAVVVSACVVLPLAVGVAGSIEPGRLLLLGPVLALAPLCFAAAVAYSLVGPSSDPDTHWVGWLIGGLTALVVLRVVVVWLKRLGDDPAPPVVAPGGTTVSLGSLTIPSSPSRQQYDEAMAALAGQLGQVAQAKRTTARDGLSMRLKRLDDLRASGAISAEEHAHRRQQILDEV